MNRHLLAAGCGIAPLGGNSSGAASYDPLVKDSDPAVVPLTSGTTTSSASARTFSPPSGGSGSYTLSVALVQDVGSGAVLAGDNSSGWYVTTLEDGDVCRIVGTWEDDTTEETVENTFVVSVAGGAASWADLRTVTMSEAATAGPWTSGTNAVADSAGDSVNIIATRVGANTGNVSVTNTVGLVITAIGGNSMIAGADASAIFTAESKSLIEPGAYVMHAVLQMTSLSTAGYIIAANSTNDVTNANLRGIRIISDGAGGYIVKAREGSTESSAIATGADATVDLAVAIMVSDGGASVRVKVAEQSTPIADPWTGSSRVGTDAIASLGTQPYDTTSRCVLAAIADDVLTVPLFGIRRYA